jgi:hypothetical protein
MDSISESISGTQIAGIQSASTKDKFGKQPLEPWKTALIANNRSYQYP